MKLSKKNRAMLESVLEDLKRGISFVLSNDTAIMRKHTLSSCDFFESQFPPYSGEKWAKITKECGNDFAVAINAARRLEAILNEPIGQHSHTNTPPLSFHP